MAEFQIGNRRSSHVFQYMLHADSALFCGRNDGLSCRPHANRPATDVRVLLPGDSILLRIGGTTAADNRFRTEELQELFPHAVYLIFAKSLTPFCLPAFRF